jgi:5'-methylthioadenosine phosphorylase
MAKKTQVAKRRGAGTEAVRIGIIGGSGLYNMPGLEKPRELRVKTPFGDPSDALVVPGTRAGIASSRPR